MIFQKVFGWLLVIAGISIIGWGIYSSFEIFTAKTNAPQLFLMPTQNISSTVSGTIDAQIQKMIGDQVSNILPANLISKILNLIAWSIFMGILFLGGGQISSIGIKLIKAGAKKEE